LAAPHRAALLPEDAVRLLAPLGVDLRIGRQLLASSVGRGEPALGSIPGVKRTVLAAVESATRAEPLAVLERLDGPDQFRKYLFAVDGGARVEAVRIPVPCEAPGAELLAFEGKEKKYLVCVSSQVGCALGCTFCATGALGFSRNLSADEIVRQVLAIRAEADRPVRGVLFMGMGEPFLNYDAVIQAAKLLSHPCGGAIDGKAITISTAGVAPAIRRYTEEGHKFRLAVSLSHARSVPRRSLMPIESTWPVAEVVSALHDHARARRTRVLVEYVLLAGQNDRPEDAEALGQLLDRRLVKLDLIDYNGRVGGHVRSSEAARSAFLDALHQAGVPFGVRYSGGQEIGAGCGQLAGGPQKQNRPAP
jgi:23S rRNA (adenine2503-C2)-methyltransferase